MKKIILGIIICLCALSSTVCAQWYSEELAQLDEKQFINSTHFVNPDEPISREEICDILVSLYKYQHPGTIIEQKSNNFTDTENSAYKNSISDAYSLGLVQGVTETEFRGKDTLTREQFAAFIHRMYGLEVTPVRLYKDFPDFSEYAAASVDFCIDKGIMSGTARDYFSPKKTLSKAEALAVVSRLTKMNDLFVEDAQISRSVIEDTKKIYIATNRDNGLLIIDKKTEQRKWFPTDRKLIGYIFDTGDTLIIPALTDENRSPTNCSGGYILDKSTEEITSFESPELPLLLCYYSGCIYFVGKGKYARYNLKTGDVTYGSEAYENFNPSRITCAKGNKLYGSLPYFEYERSTGIKQAAAFEIDLETLSAKECVYYSTLDLEIANDRYAVYSERVDADGYNWEHNLVICDVMSGNIIKKVDLKKFLNILPFNNDKATNFRERRSYGIGISLVNVDGEIYIIEDNRSRFTCVTNTDLPAIDIGLKFYFNFGISIDTLTEYYANNVCSDRYIMKSVSYSSVYNRKYYKGDQELSETCRLAEEILNRKKNYWYTYTNLYQAVDEINRYLTYNCSYDYDAYMSHGDPQYALSYTMYGVVKNQKAVCAGYAEYFYNMTNYVGVPGIILIGSNHAWNMIWLDGNYYFFDCNKNSDFGDENFFSWRSKEESHSFYETQYEPYMP